MSKKTKMVGTVRTLGPSEAGSSCPRFVFFGVEEDGAFRMMLETVKANGERWRKGGLLRSCVFSIMREDFFVPTEWDVVVT